MSANFKLTTLSADFFFLTAQNNWVARRQLNQLKTIDQIHREAKEEQQKELEMIKQMKKKGLPIVCIAMDGRQILKTMSMCM